MSALDRQVGGSHYDSALEPIVYILANKLPFIEGSVIKYVSRWKNKNGVEDLEKALHYLEILIEDVKENSDRYQDTPPEKPSESKSQFGDVIVKGSGPGLTRIKRPTGIDDLRTFNDNLWRYGDQGM